MKTKVALLESCVFSRLFYTTETRTLKAEHIRKLVALKIRCYRKSMQVKCWNDKVINDRLNQEENKHCTVMAKRSCSLTLTIARRYTSLIRCRPTNNTVVARIFRTTTAILTACGSGDTEYNDHLLQYPTSWTS